MHISSPPKVNETGNRKEEASPAVVPWNADAAHRHSTEHLLDLPGLMAIFLRRWHWIMGTLACTVAIGWLYSAMQPHIYAATTEVAVYQQEHQRNDDGLATVNKIEGLAANRSIKAQIRLLRSGELFARAFASLPDNVRNTKVRLRPVIQVQEPTEGDDTIAITVKAQTPPAATILANTLVQVLVEHDIEESRNTAASALTYVRNELNHVNNDLQTARRQLAVFQVDHGVDDDDEVLNQQMKSLSQLQLEMDQAERTAATSRNVAQALRNKLDAMSRGSLSEPQEVHNSLLDKVDMQINDLEAKRLELQQTFVPDAPEIRKVDENLRAAQEHRAQILSTWMSSKSRKSNPDYQALEQKFLTATTDADTAQIHFEVLKREFTAKRTSLAKLPTLEMRGSALKNNVNLLEASVAVLRKNYQSLCINEASPISNVRVLSRAHENPVPVSPDMRRNLVLSLVLGILLAITITVILEAWHNHGHPRRLASIS